MNKKDGNMIKTWNERCEDHPDHQTGMVSSAMIQARMQEEIDALRTALEQQAEPVSELQQVGPVEDMMLRRAALRSAKIVFDGRFVTKQAEPHRTRSF